MAKEQRLWRLWKEQEIMEGAGPSQRDKSSRILTKESWKIEAEGKEMELRLPLPILFVLSLLQLLNLSFLKKSENNSSHSIKIQVVSCRLWRMF